MPPSLSSASTSASFLASRRWWQETASFQEHEASLCQAQVQQERAALPPRGSSQVQGSALIASYWDSWTVIMTQRTQGSGWPA